MAAVQRTLLGGERVAAVWLHDAQIQKHVSHTNCARLLYSMRNKDSCVFQLQMRFVCVCLCACLSLRMDG